MTDSRTIHSQRDPQPSSSIMIAGSREAGNGQPGLDTSGRGPPRLEAAKVAAAVLKLQRLGDLDGAEALLLLVAGDLAPADPCRAGPAPSLTEKSSPGRPRAAWHAEARRLRANGITVSAIAERFSRSVSAVNYVLAADRKRLAAQ